MQRVCRLCKRSVACEHGLCPKCFNNLPINQQKDIETRQKEKRGIYSCTLDNFK